MRIRTNNRRNNRALSVVAAIFAASGFVGAAVLLNIAVIVFLGLVAGFVLMLLVMVLGGSIGFITAWAAASLAIFLLTVLRGIFK